MVLVFFPAASLAIGDGAGTRNFDAELQRQQQQQHSGVTLPQHVGADIVSKFTAHSRSQRLTLHQQRKSSPSLSPVHRSPSPPKASFEEEDAVGEDFTEVGVARGSSSHHVQLPDSEGIVPGSRSGGSVRKLSAPGSVGGGDKRSDNESRERGDSAGNPDVLSERKQQLEDAINRLHSGGSVVASSAAGASRGSGRDSDSGRIAANDLAAAAFGSGEVRIERRMEMCLSAVTIVGPRVHDD